MAHINAQLFRRSTAESLPAPSSLIQVDVAGQGLSLDTMGKRPFYETNQPLTFFCLPHLAMAAARTARSRGARPSAGRGSRRRPAAGMNGVSLLFRTVGRHRV